MMMDYPTNLAEVRIKTFRIVFKSVLDIGEQPRTALAAASDGYAIAAGLTHHFKRVFGSPNIAIAEHRNIKVFLELSDAGPIGVAAVIFGGGAGV